MSGSEGLCHHNMISRATISMVVIMEIVDNNRLLSCYYCYRTVLQSYNVRMKDNFLQKSLPFDAEFLSVRWSMSCCCFLSLSRSWHALKLDY